MYVLVYANYTILVRNKMAHQSDFFLCPEFYGYTTEMGNANVFQVTTYV